MSRKEKVSLSKLPPVRNMDGTALDANVYMAWWNDVCLLGFAASSGTRSSVKPSSNTERKSAFMLVGRRLCDIGVMSMTAYKLYVKEAVLSVDVSHEICCGNSQRFNLPFHGASFAITFNGMTEIDIEYLLTGEDHRSMEIGAVLPCMLSVSELRRKELIKRIQRNQNVARKAKELYGAKCMVPDCTLEIMQENGTPYVEVHHLREVSREGSDDMANLVLLCPHHQMEAGARMD